MNYIKLRPVMCRKVIERVKNRYATQLRELEGLGFVEVCIYYDFAPPYYLWGSLFHLFIQFLVRDQWALAWPFTFATICSLRYHPETGTYVNTYGLGSIFYNLLPDSSLYISVSWVGEDVGNKAAKIYKRYARAPHACGLNILMGLKDEADHPSQLAGHMDRHLKWVRSQHDTLTRHGEQPSLEVFQRISLIEVVALHPEL